MSQRMIAARMWRRGVISLTLGLALLVAACGPTGGGGSSPTPTVAPTKTPTPVPSCTAWQIISTPATPQDWESSLSAVTALSPSEAWAVGTIFEQWDGLAWRAVASPGAVKSVAAVSSQDVWAVGGQTIEHWNGTQWSLVANPNPKISLQAIAAVAANEVWAVGWKSLDGGGPSATSALGVERWDGTAWREVAIPTPAGVDWHTLYAITAIPGTHHLWAVGVSGGTVEFSEPVIELWDGAAWHIVASPALPSGATGGYLTAVTALSATNAWAVGHYYGNGKNRTLIVHWDGTAWQIVTSPDVQVDTIGGVAAVSANDVRVVGTVYAGQGDTYHPFIEQWNGSTWRTITGPMPQGSSSAWLNAVVPDGAGGYWAVGKYVKASGSPSQALIARCT